VAADIHFLSLPGGNCDEAADEYLQIGSSSNDDKLFAMIAVVEESKGKDNEGRISSVLLPRITLEL
jgi:hypothetical protein